MAEPDPPKHFPFLHLPQELRLEVLKHSDLIDTRYDSCLHEAVWITEDHHYHISNGCSCLRHGNPGFSISCQIHPKQISPALLLVNRQLYHEAREIFLGHNRIVLSNGHENNLKYLQSLPSSLSTRIQHLHLRFNEDVDYVKDEEHRFCCIISNPEDWDRLLVWIAENMNLSKLHLSIDLGEYWLDMPQFLTEVDAVMFTRAYRRLARPVSKLRGLHNCFVFLPCYFRMEAQMERIAIGDAMYNSIEHGKVPPISRDCRRPHAWPKEGVGFGLFDFAEDLEPWDDTIEERIAMCLHREWWVDLPALPLEHPVHI